MTETYRAGAEGAQKTSAHASRAVAYSWKTFYTSTPAPPSCCATPTSAPELEKLSQVLTFKWIEQASRGLDQVHSGMRRNLLRSLSLDSFATQLTNAARS